MTNQSPNLDSLRQAPRALRENPILFVPVMVVMALQLPQLVLRSTNPILSSIVSFGVLLVILVMMPFFQGGLIGMADEALDGRTTIQTFVAEGKSNYMSILVAYLALMAINFALGIVVFFIAIFGGTILLQEGGLQTANTAVLAGGSIVVALIFLVYLLFIFFVQFYGQAIVLEEKGVIDGIKRSASVVRHHLVSTLGYSLIGAVVGGVAGSIFATTSILLSPQSTPMLVLPEPTLSMVIGLGVITVVCGVLVGSFFAVYSVSFYRAITRQAKATAT